MLADSWKMTRIKDVCELGRGRVINQDELYDHPGQYPVYSSQSKDSGAFGCLDTFDFDGECVTWTTDGAYAGTIFYRSGRFNCTNVCGTLKAKTNEICMKYLSFGLSTKSKNHVSYVGNPKLMNNVMGNIVIPFPPLPEQRRIAEILETIDETIQKTETLISKFKAMKQGLLHDLLTRGLDNNCKLRDPNTHPEQFKDSPLGMIPREWDIGRIDQFLNPTDGIKPGPFGSSITKIMYTPEGYKVYGQEQVIAGDLTVGDYYISTDKFNELRTFEIHENDILMSLVGTVGRVLVVQSPFRPGIINPRLIRFRPFLSKGNPIFLRELLMSDIVKKQLASLFQGGTMPVLSATIVKKLILAKPKQYEQEMIAKILLAHDARIRTEEQYRDKLKLQKKGLMHDLLTGKIRVKV